MPSTPPQASSSPGAPEPPTTSSPKTTTVSSRSISCASASLIACWKVMVLAMMSPLVGDVDVGEHVGGHRVRRRLGLGHGLLDQRSDRRVDRRELGLLDQARVRHAARERVQAVAVAAQVLDLVRAAVGLLVALEVPEVAPDLAFDQGRPSARASARDRLA